ncbi:S24 family peptidase [Anaeromyxobacter oryzae]|uniref:Peptidase S24/S26A/S26B/S26C domain-containing protein n=1 Tax=Anaeromyxobacter oryzae TaxID=2918170 RepID=A0ABN6MP65_9BACT|nr:S24 family peptidase [Anaeromyxobacter oryzae]BDG02809.1 hypothetical protein AMOR_18050 [Anaeromyxobacter oryzae]
MEPIGQVIELPPPGRITAFPTLRAAAGAAGILVAGAPEAEEVVLPVRTRGNGLFAVRAAGDSMNGGTDPIRDGEWIVFRYSRGVGLGAVEGRVALLQSGHATGDSAYQVKRVVRDGRRWMLKSDNPSSPSFQASAETTPIAVLVEHISPEALGPAVGERLSDGEIGKAFGLDSDPRPGRAGGHLFVFVERPGSLDAPDRVKSRTLDRRPGETAFVLSRHEPGPWRYCGVARWDEQAAAWAFAAVDYATWRAVGAGRSSSRRLTDEQLDRARVFASSVVERHAGKWVEYAGKRCRVVSSSEQGGVRIDGGRDGFAERTVSLTDIAWVLVARDEVASAGGVLDEARVNRLRYLEGTPKGATRWIDTGWAIVLVAG